MFDLLFDLKVQGFLDYEIKEKVAEMYDIDSKVFRQLIYTEIPNKIHEIATRQHLDVIKTHSDRYEEFYRKFMEMNNHKMAMKCLKFKEVVQGVVSDDINIEVDNFLYEPHNELDYSVLDEQESDKLDKILEKLQLEISDNFEELITKEIHRRSFYEFFKDAFKVLHAGQDYNDNWHIEYLCGELQKEVERIKRKEVRQQDLVINMPFRAAKSMVCSVIFPVWAWLIDPTFKFICVSYGADLALELATKSKDLMNSSWFQDLYGKKVVLKKDQNEKGFFANTWGGFRKSVGTGGATTGSGGDIIISDDPINPKKAASKTERQNAIDYYTGTLYSRLNQLEIGVRIIVMQRLHENDLSGYLIDTSPNEHKLIRIPAEITPKAQPFPPELSKFYKDGLFWASRFSRAVLSNFTKMLGSYQAAGQLQQLPAPEEGGMVKRDWFAIVDKIQIDENTEINFYIDTADTAKTYNDPYGFCCGIKTNNMVYILDCSSQHLEFFEACKYIVDYSKKLGYNSLSKIKVEPKSSGKSIVSQIRSTTMLNVMELKAPSSDKISRLSAITPLLESGRVKLVNGAYISGFLDQLTTFPNDAHDDMVDAFVYCVTDLLLDGDFDFVFI
jgi:predicted phage terminase large subunit-like protein